MALNRVVRGRPHLKDASLAKQKQTEYCAPLTESKNGKQEPMVNQCEHVRLPFAIEKLTWTIITVRS